MSGDERKEISVSTATQESPVAAARERGILFSAPMVLALLDGRKTQTRRLAKPMPHGHWPVDGGRWVYEADENGYGGLVQRDSIGMSAYPLPKCPYGVPGDRLWVRETHAKFAVGEGLDRDVPQCVAYRATCDDDGGFDYVNGRGEVMRLTVTKWTPAIFMPRWASRITLEVTGVRVERLQDIGEADARAEGVKPFTEVYECISPDQPIDGVGRAGDFPYRASFAVLWDEINGDRRVKVPAGWPSFGETSEIDRSASWASNPWVWVVDFRRWTP